MPHVDEGQLHAYLDGAFAPSSAEHAQIQAHLASCADCRARLERERTLHGDANAILARALPRTAAMPSFEEIAARNAARQEHAVQPAKRRIPTGRLALAASLVIAMGGALLTTAIVRKNVAREDAELMSASSAPAPVVPQQTPPPLAAAAEGSAGRVAEAPLPEADVSVRTKEAGEAKGFATPAAPPPSAPQMAGAAPQPAPVIAAAEERARVGAAKSAARDASSNAAVADAMSTLATERWVEVTRADAELRLGTRVLTVPGLAVHQFEIPESPDKRAVRVTQTLASGPDLELIEELIEVPARALAPRAESAQEKKRALDEIAVTGAVAQTDSARNEANLARQRRAGVSEGALMHEVTVNRGRLQIQGRSIVGIEHIRELIARAK